jgi:hypothetical protein
MENEQIIKKESGLTYKKGFLSQFKGSLILTATELSFETKDKKQFSILLKDVLNSRAKKGLGNGLDYLIITYIETGKEKKAEFEHMNFMGGLAVGNLSQLKEPYFKSWESQIEDTRLNKNKQITSGIDDLEKLADLKQKGIITEEEFLTKKKQILGM